uniref:Mesothelin n=1 Tax=Loxodonta africana TaxID=9785 RepID=G3U9B1_LOXAF
LEMPTQPPRKTGDHGTLTHYSLVLLSLGCGVWALPSGVQAAETGQAITAAWLQHNPRDLSWWHRKLSAILLRACCPPAEEGCLPGLEVVRVDKMLVFYSEGELQACVDSALLAEQLDQVDAILFTYEQLTVFKCKLDKTYPQGYTTDVVQILGSLFLLVSPEDISKWDVMSTKTLKALVRVSRGQKADAQVAALITCYVAGGVQVDEDTLATVATLNPAYLCLLSPEQLQLLQPDILWVVKPRDLEGCPRPQMEVLPTKVHVAFQNTTGPRYLERIQPYLGEPGALVDVEALSQQNISMDMATFKELWTEALLPLTVAEVQGLLGLHVVDLKAEAQNSPVWDWIVQKRQEDLDTLGLGLQGGIPSGYLVVDLGGQGRVARGPCFSGPGSVLAVLLSLLLALT